MIAKLLRLILFVAIAFTISSCRVSYNPYYPKVNSPLSSKTINKTILVEKFVDLSDTIKYEALHKKPLKGIKKSKKAFENYDFGNEVTNAITSDFSTKGVFKNIGRKVDNPDFVLKGEIRKFTVTCNRNTLFKICAYSWLATYTVNPIIGVVGTLTFPESSAMYVLFIPSVAVLTTIPFLMGVGMGHSFAEVEIIIRLYDNKNNLLGTYIGKDEARFTDKLLKTNLKTNPNRADASFNKVLGQIQNEILDDINKLSE